MKKSCAFLEKTPVDVPGVGEDRTGYAPLSSLVYGRRPCLSCRAVVDCPTHFRLAPTAPLLVLALYPNSVRMLTDRCLSAPYRGRRPAARYPSESDNPTWRHRCNMWRTEAGRYNLTGHPASIYYMPIRRMKRRLVGERWPP